MLFTNSTFIGIDPTAGQRPFVFAAIDKNLQLLAIGQGTIDEVLAFAAGQQEALVGVCAPRRPNQGLMADEGFRSTLSPPPNPGRWTNFRVVEYLLRQRNINTPHTPAEEQECPRWMQMGFQLYQRLEGFGYSPYPHEEAGCQYLEIYPHASYSVLLGVLPYKKRTLEGRLQRQLLLYEKKLRIPDPMRFFEEITRFRLLHGTMPMNDLYTSGELDALVAAYDTWYAATHPDQTTILGDPLEGHIYLPVSDLQERYP